jgi:hypothetical protein
MSKKEKQMNKLKEQIGREAEYDALPKIGHGCGTT